MLMLTDELLDAFENELREQERAPATVEKYMRDLRAFGAYVGEGEITKQVVLDYKAYLQVKYAAASVNSTLSSLGAFFAFCERRDLCVKRIKQQKNVFVAKEKELSRAEYERLAEEKGKEYVYSILQEKDPESAKKLHYNDLKRVIRALEIYDVTGKAKSLQQDAPIPRFDFEAVSIDYPRDKLYNRINLRVEQMFAQGLMEEVQGLLRDGVTEDMQCMQGIGYKEIAEGLRMGQTEAEMMEIIKNNTRKYAKRQQTFFKRMQNHTYLTPEEATVERVAELLNIR